ncbi:MAG: diacylglycerol kinase family lipid kinase [Firmicutes bacterium]|nr:diacylglycerol kinase family lipid kinase [Bacillota bacterium]
MKVKFIINPVAGSGKGRRTWETVQKMLDGEGYPYAYAFSRYPREAVTLARQAAAAGYGVVAAVGGDGTANEVANGLMGSGAALAIVPAGTGCDYIRSLPIPPDPLGAARLVYGGQRLNVDVGLVNNRYFLGVAGLGLDAEVCRRVNENLSYLWGRTAYIVGMVATLATFRPFWVTIELDEDRLETEVTLVAVANAKYFGGGMLIAPQADPRSGYFTVCIVEGLSKLETLRVFPRIFTGSHTKHPSFRVYRSRRVCIRGPGTGAIQAEGELVGRLPLEAEILPAALPVLVAGGRGKLP